MALTESRKCSLAEAYSSGVPPSRQGLTSFTLKLTLSTCGTHSRVKLGYVGHKNSSTWAERWTNVSPCLAQRRGEPHRGEHLLHVRLRPEAYTRSLLSST